MAYLLGFLISKFVVFPCITLNIAFEIVILSFILFAVVVVIIVAFVVASMSEFFIFVANF